MLLAALGLAACLAGCGMGGGQGLGRSPAGRTGSSAASAAPGLAVRSSADSRSQPAELSPQQAAQVAPLAPARVDAQPAADGVAVTWPGTGEDNVQYTVSRRPAATPNWQRLAGVAAAGQNGGSYAYTDRTVVPGAAYVYGVTAVNGAGTSSTRTESSAVVAPGAPR